MSLSPGLLHRKISIVNVLLSGGMVLYNTEESRPETLIFILHETSMISTVKQFFEKHVISSPGNSDNVSEHALQIATAALLIEMMRADAEISRDEEKKIADTISAKFKLTDTETAELLQMAEEKIWKSTGYFEFTSLMNKGLSYEQKIKVIEQLWDVAFADAILDKHEEYMVRKIAGLIHVSHKDFIDAKLRVKKRLRQSSS